MEWTDITLREQAEVYTSIFAGENDALRLDKNRFYEENTETKGT